MIGEFKGEYRWLSNFTPCKVVLDGHIYPSTEHAYQAAKTLSFEEREAIRTSTAAGAKRLGREVTIRRDWDTVKDKVMEDLQRQKYSQEPFMSELIATGDQEIVEGNLWHDNYWGACYCGKCIGTGQNKLGKLIMKIRASITNKVVNSLADKAITELEITKSSNCYTGVGSRETPPEILKRMQNIANVMTFMGLTLRSGGAQGADTAFQRGCEDCHGDMEIYLPWDGFENNWMNARRGDELILAPRLPNWDEAMDIAGSIHPAWHRLTEGMIKLHTRNVYQVLGPDLNTPSDFLICWTKDGRPTGGTATAINLALKHGIMVYNIHDMQALTDLYKIA